MIMEKVSAMYISNKGELGGTAQSLLNVIKGWDKPFKKIYHN